MGKYKSWANPRNKGPRNIRKTFWIFCGGMTEFIYFQGMKCDLRNKINIEINLKPIGVDAKSLVEKMIKWKTSREKDAMELFFIVFDRDPGNNTEKQIKETIEKSIENKINPIISNKSFEVRLIMHYENFLKSVQSVKEYEDILSKHLGEKYEKTDQDMYIKFKGKTAEAITNSKKNEKQQIEDGGEDIRFCEPYTEVYKLVEEIIKS